MLKPEVLTDSFRLSSVLLISERKEGVPFFTLKLDGACYSGIQGPSWGAKFKRRLFLKDVGKGLIGLR
jgi:hypothetical protein